MDEFKQLFPKSKWSFCRHLPWLGLTLRGWTLQRKPWVFGALDSHQCFSFLSRRSRFHFVHPCSRNYFFLRRNVPLLMPCYCVHTIILDDPNHLLFVPIMRTTLIVGCTGFMTLYELVIFYLSAPFLIQCGEKVYSLYLSWLI